jgi:nitrogen fixation NifU-like protein
MEELYREVILDHYKNPRGHGVIEDPDAQAEGLNPLCGDEVSIYVQFAEDGETIDEVKFSGRGCAISQASTSMLMEMAKGRTAQEIAELPKEELLDEVGIPLTPVRLKCALLGLGVLKVALHRAKGTPLPEEWAGLDELDLKEYVRVHTARLERARIQRVLEAEDGNVTRAARRLGISRKSLQTKMKEYGLRDG